MSLVCTQSDGERYALLAPFASGAGSVIERVGAGEYCATMRAYYSAVASACSGTSGGFSWCGGHAGPFCGEHVCGVAGCVGKVASVIGSCDGGGSRPTTAGDVVSGGGVGAAGCAAGTDSATGGGVAGKSVESVVDDVSGGDRIGSGVVELPVVGESCGKWRRSNRRKKEKRRAARSTVPEWRRGARPLAGDGVGLGDEKKSDSAYGSGGSVCTVDTRTGVEIAAAQTLAARRVAENERAEAEAKVAKKLAEHRLVALQDKDRTVAVQRLAAARYEQKINEAKAKSQASYKKCDESMKSLGSTGSAGEFALKQMVKEARDNAKTLKYVQEQADLFYQYATPEVRRMVAEMPEPEMEDEFDVFGDCPSDYDEEQREAYYDDLNRRNANHGLVGSSPAPPRRELTPEEFLKIEEEIRALSANQV